MASPCAAGSSSVGCGAVGLRRRFSEGEKGFGGCEMGIPAAAEVGGGEKLRGRSRFFAAFWEESRGQPGEFGNKEKPSTLSQPGAQPDGIGAVSCLRARRCVAC